MRWIDLGHADPKDEVSVLFTQINANKSNLDPASERIINNLVTSSLKSKNAINGLSYRNINALEIIKKWDGFYIIKYAQSMSKTKFNITVSASKGETFLIKRNLSPDEKKSVALGIFMKVSHGFETMQGAFPYSFVTDSGYSVEDLLSNLLGFYRAIEPTKNFLMLSEPVSEEQSYYVWDTFGSVGSNKNKQFSPFLYPTSAESKTRLGLAPLPYFLNTVSPAQEGNLFIELK